MKKILILCLGLLLSLSVIGKNREHMNPAMMDAVITNHILNELRDAGYTVLPEVVVVAYRNDQDTIRKDFRHQRGPGFQNDTLKRNFSKFQSKEFQGRMGRPEFGRPDFRGKEFGRPEFRGNMRRGEMRGREMKRENMRKMDCPCIKKQNPMDPTKPSVG